MATLADLSVNTYKGTPTSIPISSLLLSSLPGWQVIATSTRTDASDCRHFGVACYNAITQQLVIANRGTDTDDCWNTALKNLLVSDFSLTVHLNTAFWRARLIAGVLFILEWPSFATALNYSIGQLNPQVLA